MKKSYQRTPEIRAKNSIANMGHSVSAETRAKIRATQSTPEYQAWMRAANLGDKNPMWGKHPSEETRAKLRITRARRIFSDETKAKISASKSGSAQIGNKNPNWKGGRYKKCGYEFIRIGWFYVFAHRVAMAQAIGHALQTGAVVHHINRNRQDNQIENLALCSDHVAHKWCATEEARVFFG